MRILVTGGTGFIGRAVVLEALRRGHQVAVMARTPPASVGESLFIPGEMASPPWSGLERFAPEACIHSAWIATPGVYQHSPENDLHLEWSTAFLNRLLSQGVRLTALGTCIEYADTGHPSNEETTPLQPGIPYSQAKDALRQRLFTSPPAGARIAWGRVFYPYGPGEDSRRIGTAFIDDLRRRGTLLLQTPESRKDLIFIDDLARAIVTVTESPYHGTINLGTGQATTLLEFARRIASALGIDESAIERKDRPGDCRVAVATRLEALGWSPQVGLDEGIVRLLRSLD